MVLRSGAGGAPGGARECWLGIVERAADCLSKPHMIQSLCMSRADTAPVLPRRWGRSDLHSDSAGLVSLK